MVWCNRCGQEIFFDKTVRSASGKMIPLDPDRQKHNHDPNDPNEPLNKKWTRNPNFVKPIIQQSQQSTANQYESSNNFRIREPLQQQQQTIPKGQFDQRGGESEYRRPIDDLINQHHNALTQLYNNIDSKLGTILQRINEESEKQKELWRILDATAATVGVYKTHSALDEWKQKQRNKLENELTEQQKQAEQDVIDEDEYSDHDDIDEEKIVNEVGE